MKTLNQLLWRASTDMSSSADAIFKQYERMGDAHQELLAHLRTNRAMNAIDVAADARPSLVAVEKALLAYWRALNTASENFRALAEKQDTRAGYDD